MEIKAKLNYLRIAPRKVRSAVDLIRGKALQEAEDQLKFVPRRASDQILKLLKSAEANAKSNFNIDKKDLFIEKIVVNEGVPYKRWRPMSRGRAYPILKRTSHIIVSLGVKKGVKIEKIKRSQENINEKIIEKKEETKTQIKTTDKRVVKKNIQKPKKQNWVKRIFRRKSM